MAAAPEPNPNRRKIASKSKDVMQDVASGAGRPFTGTRPRYTGVLASSRWAEKLDELARELDVVIVVAAGNRSDLPIPEGAHTVEELQTAIRQGLLDPDQWVCNLATSALALSVGAIARSDATDGTAIGGRVMSAFAGAPEGAPAPFTRASHTGPGGRLD